MMAIDDKKDAVMLSDLLSSWLEVPASMDCLVQGLTLDSRAVQAGDVFLACIGQTVNAVQFIGDAIERGASAVIWETEDTATAITFSMRQSMQGREVPCIALENLSDKAGLIADQFYGEPSKQMFVTGITGTNGKTSCSHFLAQALNENEMTGVIGTLGNGVYGKVEAATHTTPDVVTCHKLMAEMNGQGAQNIAMEVSSHALDQGRVNGVDFDCAVFTNLSRDHLDYHGNMESYLASKLKLFTSFSLSSAVINLDDQAATKILSVIPKGVRVISYGLNELADVYAYDIQLTRDGMVMNIKTPWGTGKLKTSLLGRFNISNLLAVLCVLLVKGIELGDALDRLGRLQGIAGRMQHVQKQGKPLVVIDYAHTPDALEHVLTALKEHAYERVWCVFGCGGDRDQGKRSLMGTVAESLANKVIITTDNPRTEDPEVIASDICEGIANLSQVDVILDRAEAIEFAIRNATEDDVILVAGKGHETYQEVNGKRYPFSDLDIAQQYLEVNA